MNPIAASAATNVLSQHTHKIMLPTFLPSTISKLQTNKTNGEKTTQNGHLVPCPSTYIPIKKLERERQGEKE